MAVAATKEVEAAAETRRVEAAAAAEAAVALDEASKVEIAGLHLSLQQTTAGVRVLQLAKAELLEQLAAKAEETGNAAELAAELAKHKARSARVLRPRPAVHGSWVAPLFMSSHSATRLHSA